MHSLPAHTGTRHRYAVALVVLAQWLGTSLWFSPSGAAAGLMAQLGIGSSGFAWLLAATQLGFIAGTLTFAATGMADRMAASRIFAVSSLLGAVANAALVLPGLDFAAVWGLRCAVGLCLAGIYPLGMKMVVQWVGGKPAAALGWLVGMLALDSALAVQNGIGFLITVVSIMVMGWALPAWGVQAVWILLPGPVLGLWALRPLLVKNTSQIV